MAVINRTRNILEKKLRQLVLNFLRADALATKKKGTTRERILVTVQPDRKKRMASLAPDDVVEQLLWAELTAVIIREWPIFGGVFADRKQFEQHTAIVNDRPDAHAKNADAADLAMYRRSLKWLSDRITAI